MTPFDVVLVPFPFADLSTTKRRPCLVLATFKPRSLGEHCVLALMTSQISPPNFKHDVTLNNFEKAGLPKPTLVRLSKVVTVQSDLIVKRIGALVVADQIEIKKEFKNLFQNILK